MRTRHNKRAIRSSILLTVGERERGKTKGESEEFKEGPRDKTGSDGRD
jgi:hypothetical protein